MQFIDEDALRFEFPDSWLVSKYDKWAYYQNQFQAACSGDNKAADILAIDRTAGGVTTLWIIEIKDFRRHRREKAQPLEDEIVSKFKDTMAGIFAAGMNDSHADHHFARSCLAASKVRFVLHLEQVEKPSKQNQRDYDPASVKQNMRLKLRAIDPHPLVLNKTNTANLGWIVSDKPTVSAQEPK